MSTSMQEIVVSLSIEVALRNILHRWDDSLPFQDALASSLTDSLVIPDWALLAQEHLVGWAVQVIERKLAEVPEAPTPTAADEELAAVAEVIAPKPATKSASFSISPEVYDLLNLEDMPHVWEPEVGYLYFCGVPAIWVDDVTYQIEQAEASLVKAPEPQAPAPVVQEPVKVVSVDEAPEWHPAHYRTMQQFLKWARDVRKVELRCKCNQKAEVLKAECLRVERLLARKARG